MKELRILIADDHALVRHGLRSVLEAQAGWIVCGEAENGRQAVKLGLELIPDIFLLDVTMPELNGYQTCRELKKVRQELPVLILTGKTEPADRFWAMECGADEFLTKPADPAVVLQKLAELLRL